LTVIMQKKNFKIHSTILNENNEHKKTSLFKIYRRKQISYVSYFRSFLLGSLLKAFFFKNEFAPLIATICDEQIRSEDAWSFPEWLNNKLGTLELSELCKLERKEFKKYLEGYLNVKWPSGMKKEDRRKYLEKTSQHLYNALNFFSREGKTPVTMFENREYSSLEIYFMLRRLPGFGPKKASMITRD